MNFKIYPRFVYLIRSVTEDIYQYKIGVSHKPEKRLLEIQTANPNELEVLHKFRSQYPFLLETSLKNRFSPKNINGEWFDLSESDINNFIETCTKMESNFQIIRETSTLYS